MPALKSGGGDESTAPGSEPSLWQEHQPSKHLMSETLSFVGPQEDTRPLTMSREAGARVVHGFPRPDPAPKPQTPAFSLPPAPSAQCWLSLETI